MCTIFLCTMMIIFKISSTCQITNYSIIGKNEHISKHQWRNIFYTCSDFCFFLPSVQQIYSKRMVLHAKREQGIVFKQIAQHQMISVNIYGVMVWLWLFHLFFICQEYIYIQHADVCQASITWIELVHVYICMYIFQYAGVCKASLT